MNIENIYGAVGRLLSPEGIVIIIFALAGVSVGIFFAPWINLLCAVCIEDTTSDERRKLGRILRLISYMLMGVWILAVIAALLRRSDWVDEVVMYGIAANSAFCVLCGLITGLIPWHWRFQSATKGRTRPVRFLPPVVDIKTQPVSFVLAMLFEFLMALLFVQVAQYGLAQ